MVTIFKKSQNQSATTRIQFKELSKEELSEIKGGDGRLLPNLKDFFNKVF